MYSLWIFAMVSATLCILEFIRKRRSPTPSKFSHLPLPPGPKPEPIIGNLRQIPLQGAESKYTEWSHQYGDLLHLRVFGQPIVVFNSYEVAKSLMDKAIYASRPKLVMVGELMSWSMSIPFAPYGETWKRYRRALHPHMQKNAVHRYWNIQTAGTRKFLQNLLDTPDTFFDSLRLKASKEIMDSVYGLKVTSVKDKYLWQMEESIRNLETAVFPGSFLVDTFPQLMYLPNWFPGGGFKRTAAEWKKTNESSVTVPFEKVKEQMSAGVAAPSMTCSMLETGDYEDEDVKWVCGSLYSAGIDTVAETLHIFFLAMTLHPEVLQRAQAELDKVVGTQRLPTMEDRPNLPYIENVIKEVMRWIPVGPLGIPHYLTEDDQHEGYRIPAGAIVFTNIWAISQDENNYVDPKRFWPERFELGKAAGKEPLHPSAYVWGVGRRTCAGRYWAESTLFITIASVLATFDISKARDELGNEIEPERGMLHGLVNRPKPFKCSIKPRSQAAATLIRTVGSEDE
ncbi:hypothetical protein BOTBODRAFT_356488 [Botryobasidium botryosum FD-172 SS1]|uniref:Cytochrome P450 n=1 Tax=Botryobasidium botryosum (strain FD-172 SS1) TaxID=930990 RepID=A0A067MDZ1_BOTB1|nr:hypothetical protein BOTBODRAFT_356488 [Botryobasidium botryosum FD-172 SS1]